MKLLTIATGLLLGISFGGCTESAKGPAVLPEVTVVEVGHESLPVYSEYVGQTFGQSDIEIRPRVEGWLEQINFKEGERVSQGQLLYVIQDDQQRDRVDVATSQLEQSRVMLIKAKADLDRVKPLAQMNALSQRDLDAAQATYDAQVQAVNAAKASLQTAQIQLGYTKITSPITGIIGVSRLLVGDFVQRGGGQQPLNTISSLGEMRVRFNITESDYLKFRREMTRKKADNIVVQLILNDGSLFPETGRLDFVNREIDPATGSLLVQALVPNKSQLLRPGQYVRVRFVSDEISDAVVVPQQAINQMQNIYLAYVIGDSNKLVPQPVKTGMRIGSNWVITEGLKPGQKVALVGNALIKPNLPVNPILTPYSYDSTSGTK